MRRLVWGLIVLCLALASSASAAMATRVRVSPAKGGIHTSFVVRFSIPDATGTTGDVGVSDSLSVVGRDRPGCIGDTEVPLRPAAAGTAFRLRLDPTRLNGHWCTGRFTGVLIQRQMTACPPGPQLIICPLYVVAPRVLARFRFTVAPPKKTVTTR